MRGNIRISQEAILGVAAGGKFIELPREKQINERSSRVPQDHIHNPKQLTENYCRFDSKDIPREQHK
jgi:hypothetical protein